MTELVLDASIVTMQAPVPPTETIAYEAYKTVRQDEPAFSVDLIYYQMYMLAIGLQMAGPDLNPQTFEAGMFNYPAKTGPFGLWDFGVGDRTAGRQRHQQRRRADGSDLRRLQAHALLRDAPESRVALDALTVTEKLSAQGKALVQCARQRLIAVGHVDTVQGPAAAAVVGNPNRRRICEAGAELKTVIVGEVQISVQPAKISKAAPGPRFAVIQGGWQHDAALITTTPK